MAESLESAHIRTLSNGRLFFFPLNILLNRPFNYAIRSSILCKTLNITANSIFEHDPQLKTSKVTHAGNGWGCTHGRPPIDADSMGGRIEF